MHKLVILIPTTHSPQFDAHWAKFLHIAERIPGLRREATSRVGQLLYGQVHYELIHELFFDSYAELEYGLNAPEGQQAGQLLQAFTGGEVVLLLAEHHQDELEHIRLFKGEPPAGDAP
jgi:uncharacterized protein (TIGR02118 family)